MSSGIKFDSLPIIVPDGKTIRDCKTSGFGPRHVKNNPGASKYHRGIDLAFPGCQNKSILAVASGKIRSVTIAPNTPNPRGLPVDDICGNGVSIVHTETDGKTQYITLYCHMSEPPSVAVGQQVAAATVIGKIGDTGNPKKGSYHLHFTLRSLRFTGYAAVDPEPYLYQIGVAIPPVAPPPLPVRSTPGPGTLREGLSSKITGLYSFHPFIQYELTRRRFASETANTHTPFVRLTSLLYVFGKNTEIGKGDETKAYCPSLGVHGQPEVLFESIYTPQGGRSIVGWATNQENPKQSIEVVVENSTEDPPNIPPPGIVSMTTERNTAGAMGVRGGLFRANLKITAYSIGQLNTLLRYFLRPATRVVLELGRKSSSPGEQELNVFNWNRPLSEINDEIEAIVRTTDSQGIKTEELIRKYVYDNFGNYEIFIGYVANFKFKYTKSNTYDIDLEIHSAQQFELPVKLSGARSLCGSNNTGTPSSCGVLDIEDYFSSTSGYKGNSFTTLLSKAIATGDPINTEYGDHVIQLLKPSNQGNTGDGGYLVSWKFFINKILNDENYGLLGVLKLNDSLPTKILLRNAFPKPIPLESTDDEADTLNLNAYEVGWHPYLRSTDAGTMIINNPKAQTLRKDADIADLLKTAEGVDTKALNNTEIVEKIKTNTTNPTVGGFTESLVRGKVSSLSRGVWLNTNAIIESFANADTVSAGLDNLLTKMNNATQGYWNLQLLSNDQKNPGVHIIDMALSKPNTQPALSLLDDQTISGVQETRAQDVAVFGTTTPNYLYMFNKKLKRRSLPSVSANDRRTTTSVGEAESLAAELAGRDNSIGGEVLDITYEASLPTVIAVQAIAGVGGVAQRGTLAAIDVEELRQLALYNIYPSCTDTPDNNCGTPDASRKTVAAGYVVLSQNDIQYYTKTYAEAKTEDARVLVLQELDSQVKTINEQSRILSPRGNIEVGAGPIAIQYIKEKQLIRERTDISPEERNRLIVQLTDQYYEKYYRGNLEKDVEKLKADLQTAALAQNGSYVSLVKDYSGLLGAAIEFIAYDKTAMVQQLDLLKKETEVHSFNSSNLTKTTVDLTIPGIGGISLFEAFAVDRLPNMLDRGYYIVTKVAHDFNVNTGWVTKLTGRFRYRPPGTPAVSPPGTPASEANLGADFAADFAAAAATRLTNLSLGSSGVGIGLLQPGPWRPPAQAPALPWQQ